MLNRWVWRLFRKAPRPSYLNEPQEAEWFIPKERVQTSPDTIFASVWWLSIDWLNSRSLIGRQVWPKRIRLAVICLVLIAAVRSLLS